MKGLVEGLVKFARLNFLVPVPQVRDFDELNTHLLEMCREDMSVERSPPLEKNNLTLQTV